MNQKKEYLVYMHFKLVSGVSGYVDFWEGDKPPPPLVAKNMFETYAKFFCCRKPKKSFFTSKSGTVLLCLLLHRQDNVPMSW